MPDKKQSSSKSDKKTKPIIYGEMSQPEQSEMELVQPSPLLVQRFRANPQSVQPREVLQLQRLYGNAAVGQVLRRQPAPTIQRTPKRAKMIQRWWGRGKKASSEPSTAPRQAPNRPLPPMPGQTQQPPQVDLNNLPSRERTTAMKINREEINRINSWLRGKAFRQGKTELFDYYNRLNDASQISVLQWMLGEQNITLALAKQKMKSFFRWKRGGLDWDRFSEGVRLASFNQLGADPWANRQIRDYSGIALGGLSGGAAIGSSTANIASAMKTNLAGNAFSEASSGIAMLGALHQAGDQYYETGQKDIGGMEKATTFNKGSAGLADAVRYGATGAKTLAEMSSKMDTAISTGAATATAGVAGVVGGTFYLASGTVGTIAAHKRVKELETMETNDEKLKGAIELAGSTQRLNRTVNASTAVKGAAMIVGGAMLLASNPVGWMVLGGAAALGAIFALWKYMKWRQRKTDLVDRELKVEDKLQEYDSQHPEEIGKFTRKSTRRDKIRNKELQRRGFNNVDQFYKSYLTVTAQYLHDKGVGQGNPTAIKIIENTGLKVDRQAGLPTTVRIAQRLEY